MDESRLRCCLDACSGQFKSITPFKSISLGQHSLAGRGLARPRPVLGDPSRSSGLMIRRKPQSCSRTTGSYAATNRYAESDASA